MNDKSSPRAGGPSVQVFGKPLSHPPGNADPSSQGGIPRSLVPRACFHPTCVRPSCRKILDPREFSLILQEQPQASVPLEHSQTGRECRRRNRGKVFDGQTRQSREGRGLRVPGCERVMRLAGPVEYFARPFHTTPAVLRVHSRRRETPAVSSVSLTRIAHGTGKTLPTRPQGFPPQSALDQVWLSLQLSRCLKHAFPVFVIANSDRVTDGRQKDLAIPDLAGLRSF